jgi:hypothetical protein
MSARGFVPGVGYGDFTTEYTKILREHRELVEIPETLELSLARSLPSE